MIRCASCSDKLGALSTLFVRGEITRQEWSSRAYKGVQAHHAGWTMSQVWGYARDRAPFYPCADELAGEHRYPGEKVAP